MSGSKSSNATTTQTTTNTTNRQLANNADGTIVNVSDIGAGAVLSQGNAISLDGLKNTGTITIDSSDAEVAMRAIQAAELFNLQNNTALGEASSNIIQAAKDSNRIAEVVAKSQENFVAQASGNKTALYLIGGGVVVGGIFFIVNRNK